VVAAQIQLCDDCHHCQEAAESRDIGFGAELLRDEAGAGRASCDGQAVGDFWCRVAKLPYLLSHRNDHDRAQRRDQGEQVRSIARPRESYSMMRK
jgi:hypothetical protein